MVQPEYGKISRVENLKSQVKVKADCPFDLGDEVKKTISLTAQAFLLSDVNSNLTKKAKVVLCLVYLSEDGYMKVGELDDGAAFFRMQETVNPTTHIVPSHCVIDAAIRRYGHDYRYQIAPSPVPELRNRREDNTSVGRKPDAAPSTRFTCND